MNVSQILKIRIPLLDPNIFSDLSIVSHAHSDHLAFNLQKKKRIIICSKETSKIAQFKLHEDKDNFRPIEYFKEYSLLDLNIPQDILENYDYKDLSISILPAGHVLGSSQIMIKTRDISLLYSGDFKTRISNTSETLKYPDSKIDYLIMESTFGKNKYVFPSKEIIQSNLINFCKESIQDKYIPIIYAYSLGKSQEVLSLLKNNDFNILVHGAVYNICKIYESFNIDIGKYYKYSKENMKNIKNCVLIIPPHYSRSRMITNIPNRKTSIVTGWAIDNSAKYIHKTDEIFPLSDHADFNELISYARKINASQTLITHGFRKDLTRELNKIGLNSIPLDEFNPNSLF